MNVNFVESLLVFFDEFTRYIDDPIFLQRRFDIQWAHVSKYNILHHYDF